MSFAYFPSVSFRYYCQCEVQWWCIARPYTSAGPDFKAIAIPEGSYHKSIHSCGKLSNLNMTNNKKNKGDEARGKKKGYHTGSGHLPTCSRTGIIFNHIQSLPHAEIFPSLCISICQNHSKFATFQIPPTKEIKNSLTWIRHEAKRLRPKQSKDSCNLCAGKSHGSCSDSKILQTRLDLYTLLRQRWSSDISRYWHSIKLDLALMCRTLRLSSFHNITAWLFRSYRFLGKWHLKDLQKKAKLLNDRDANGPGISHFLGVEESKNGCFKIKKSLIIPIFKMEFPKKSLSSLHASLFLVCLYLLLHLLQEPNKHPIQPSPRPSMAKTNGWSHGSATMHGPVAGDYPATWRRPHDQQRQ